MTALKALQGHVWRTGFTKGQITAELYRDVPDMLTELGRMGIKSYIYSSGSREAQRLFFGHTQVLCVYRVCLCFLYWQHANSRVSRATSNTRLVATYSCVDAACVCKPATCSRVARASVLLFLWHTAGMCMYCMDHHAGSPGS